MLELSQVGEFLHGARKGGNAGSKAASNPRLTSAFKPGLNNAQTFDFLRREEHLGGQKK